MNNKGMLILNNQSRLQAGWHTPTKTLKLLWVCHVKAQASLAPFDFQLLLSHHYPSTSASLTIITIIINTHSHRP